MSTCERQSLHFAQAAQNGTEFFANFDTLDVSPPNFSRAFGARAGVMGYVRMVYFTFLLKPHNLGQIFCKF